MAGARVVATAALLLSSCYMTRHENTGGAHHYHRYELLLYNDTMDVFICSRPYCRVTDTFFWHAPHAPHIGSKRDSLP